MAIRIPEEVQDFYEEVQGIYRKLHSEPEIEFNVHKTAGFVAQYLKDLGLEVIEGIGKTGVFAILKGNIPSDSNSSNLCIMFRADMDALPIEEETNLPYKSLNPGCMHACGHDAHVAMLLVAAKILTMSPDFQGSIKFVFQPAEENLKKGALEMIKDGVLENVDEVYAIHVGKPLKVGDYLYNNRFASVNSDQFIVNVIGKGGHGSCPEGTNDPIPVSAALIQAFCGITANRQRPFRIQTNIVKTSDTYNAIPTSVQLKGAVRSLDSEDREYVIKRMNEICLGLEVAYDIKIELEFIRGYGTVKNNENCGFWCLRAIRQICFGNRFEQILQIGEDFSYFTDRKPGAYLLIGCGEGEYGMHSSKFFIDEQVLLVGISYWVTLAKNRLNSENFNE